MLRYAFYLLPLFTALFVWMCNGPDSVRVFIIPTILLIIGVFGMFRLKGLSRIAKLMVVYVLFSLIIELIAYPMALNGSNSAAYHFCVFGQVLLFGAIYSRSLVLKRYQVIYWAGIGIILLLELFISFFWTSLNDFPSLNIVVLAAQIIPLTLFQFRQMILYPVALELEKQPLFWFNFGTFVFFTLNFFILGFLSSIQELPSEMYQILWGSNVFLYATYFIAIYLDSKIKSVKP